jgi:hypothetical protein
MRIFAYAKCRKVRLCNSRMKKISLIRLVAALGVLIPGLVLVAGTGVASASTGPGNTIATAGTLDVGDTASGGGGPIDFWKVTLNGGDVVQFATTTPAYTTYVFSLFAPGTTDANFPQAASFSSQITNYQGVTAKSVIDLQAPYNGTFILAVCENVSGNNCVNVDSGSGTNPMDPYTFKTSFASSVSNTVAASETKASPAISGSARMGTGNFESGGANAIDFWKVTLNGGDVVQFSSTTPAYTTYTFSLYRGSTTDTSFPQAAALSTATTNYFGVTAKSVFDLQAPFNGTFILAVCENVSGNNCVNVDSGSGTNPMDPYTFSTKLTGGHETRTSLKLSAATVVYGHEKALKFSVAVGAVFGGRATGKVYVSDGRKTVCVVRLVNGRGTCSPATNTAIPVGKYAVTASYTGNLLGSKSGTVTLTVKK